jgi:2,4-dienoyl-CoA reductase-like NADH-dependent reductase (Old Yellow Enzyme family)
MAQQIRETTGLPTIAVGLITEPEQAQAIIESGQADFVALARGMLYNPRWPWHAAAKLGAQVQVPKQFWRSQPQGLSKLFGGLRLGQR